MKKLSAILFSLFMLLIPGSFIKAQDITVVFDTIKFEHPDFYLNNFSLSDTLIHTISIQISPAAQMKDVHFNFGGDVLRGMMTVVTGIGFGSTKDVDWYLASIIRTNIPKLDWIFDVYCPGYIEKERTRVNDNGSTTVETNYVNHFSWQKGALGFIIEAGDTIGWHYIYTNPRTDTALRRWLQPVYKGKQEHSSFNYFEFGLLGKLTGKESLILFNQDENRIYIFTGDKLLGIYQCQKPPQFKLNKKKRIVAQPYLLVNKTLTDWERLDAMRLAMVGFRMKRAIGVY